MHEMQFSLCICVGSDGLLLLLLLLLFFFSNGLKVSILQIALTEHQLEFSVDVLSTFLCWKSLQKGLSEMTRTRTITPLKKKEGREERIAF